MEDSRGRKLSFMKMWLDHVGDQTFNLAGEPKPAQFAAMNFPVFTATGFFDDDQPGALHYYRRFLRYASPQEAAGILLVLGPWDHVGSPDYQKNYNTGGRIGYEDPKSARVAHITLFHGGRRTSALLLPLAARSSMP
jgi:predicted acyl esterase